MLKLGFMSRDWKDTLTRLDADIRGGRLREARASLKALAKAKLPRPALAEAANLAWRASNPAQGIKWLSALVRPAARKPITATATEKAEYGACLVKVGALSEACDLLAGIAPADEPRAALYLAFAKVAQWDYGGSIPLLKQYLASPKLTAYQKLVGQTNLAAALVEQRRPLEATFLLRKLLHDLHLGGHQLLLGRALLLSAENFLNKKDWKQAVAFLEKAEGLLRETDSLDHFLIRKFRAIAAFLKSPGTPTLTRLHEIRLEAAGWRHWETIRDCDRYEAVALQDETLITHLYFGTPFESFRRKLADDVPAFQAPDSHVWKLKRGAGPVLNLSTGKGGRAVLKVGQSLHRLLLALASDFYRPLRTAELHALAFPGEFFHPVYSAQKLRTLISRLRTWLARSKIPLAVIELDGGYRLGAERPCALELPAPRMSGGAVLEKLRLGRGASPFSAAQAADTLGVSDRTARRYLETAAETGEVEVLGKGKARRYVFLKTASKTKAS